ncbi:MAG: DUF5069 domain-containing protein [bacterium]
MTRVPCSPNERTNGMVWFPRMLDKIRLPARGELPADYIPGASSSCCWRAGLRPALQCHPTESA